MPLQKNRDASLFEHSTDGIDRRGFLKCMAWAGTGELCVLERKRHSLALIDSTLE